LLAEKGRAILTSTQGLLEEMDTFQGRLAGMVTLMCTYSMAGGKMLDDVQEFLTYPDHARVRIRMQQQGRWGVAQAIREGRSSLGVLWNLADTAGLQTFAYRRDQIGAVVNRSHPLAGRTSVSYDEAAEFETVRIYTGRATEAMLERTGAIKRAARHNRVEVPNFEVALRLVSAGPYLAFVPLEMAQFHGAALNIAAIPLTDTWANRHNVIACRDETSLAPCAQALLRHLIAAAAQSADSGDAPVPTPATIFN
jgi:DNA-binding transcriptional LysR family regulator